MKRCLFASILLIVLVSSCVPTSTPTPAPAPADAISPAVATIDTFYQYINDAQSPNDLGKPWDMYTLEAMCNPRDYCDLTIFTDRWWSSKLNYRLYDCGNNRVIAEEMRYPRDNDSTVAPAKPQYWKYQLIEVEGRWMIDDTSARKSLDAECMLVIDRSANP